MPWEADPTTTEVMAAFRDVMQAIEADSAPSWTLLDLTMGQIRGLVTLAKEGPLTIGELAGALGIGQPSASILVGHLVRAGLVERAEDPADRRRTFARLSRRGEELIGQLRQDKRERVRRWLAELADDDLAALARGLRALAAAARAERGAAAPAGAATA
ncbi:MAG TPA: MarR family transcriptional regulator [Thermomicrobiales bacterium]|nr:MarR family transcriptional regulator [Thermomicrobiales bacterium]